jgi:hypothetical protein
MFPSASVVVLIVPPPATASAVTITVGGTGTIILTGTGQFPYYLTVTAASDGTFALPEVLAGPFTARLSANNGGFTLYGTASGTVTPNQNATLSIQVQPSGTVSGVVLRPDGITPAIGASITIQLLTGVGGSINLQAQNDGSFSAIGVPLGAFSVQINDPVSGGLAAIIGQSISSNGQTVNLGTITLDGNALSVVSTNPINGATNVAVSQPITVTFSEALASTTGIYVTSGTNNVPMYSTLSSDGKTVTLQGTMPDGVPLVLNVTGQVTDVFGRQLLAPQTISFTTVDLTPPYVVSVSPANQAIQVPVNTIVTVTFNKALSATAPLNNVITLSSVAGPVAGNTSLSALNTLTFTPSAPLMNNTIYTVTVDGAVSFGGNVQTNAFTSSFVSPETTAPVLQLNSPSNGSYVNTATPTISISLSDQLSGINPATAVLSLDGQAVTPSVSSYSIAFTPTTPLAGGSHTISAFVQNNAGIPGTLTASFIVDTAPPSIASLTGISPSQVLQGQIAISASATDTVSGIAKINFLVDGVVQAVLTAPNYSILFNTAQLQDGPHSFSAQAVNNAGTSGPASAAIQAYIENIPLTVTITSPQSGAPFGNQVQVTAITSKPVTQVAFTLLSQTITVTSTPYQAIFNLVNISAGQQTITATATYIDGSTAATSVTIIVDHSPPSVNPVLIAANPPVNGISVVRGLPGATSAGAQLTIVNTTHAATVTASAASDGSFSTNIAGAFGDVLSLVATNAAGNSSTAITFTIPQTAPLPQVSQVDPADGSTNVYMNTHVVVRFTQPVAPTSVVTGTLSVMQGNTQIAGSLALSNDSLSLTFTPTQSLAASTTYTVIVQDIANGQTTPLFQSTFTTGSASASVAPQIVIASPQNGATSVPTNSPVHVLFTEAMDPSTLTSQNFIVTDETTGQPVPGMIQVDATQTSASFVPQPPYGIGRNIYVSLTSNIKDLFGNSLTGSGMQFSFTAGFGLDNQAPTLLGTSPAVGMTGVPLNSLIVAEFDSPLDVVTTTQNFQVQLNGVAISGGIALSDSNKRITFTPLGAFTPNSTYTISIPSQITDIAGNSVVNPGGITFSTATTTDTSLPQVTNISPLNGVSGVPVNAEVQLQFSKLIDPYTVNNTTFYIYPTDTGIPVAASIAVSTDGMTVTLTPAAPLQTETGYQVVATNGITDMEGQGIPNFYASFTTGLGAATTGPTVVSMSPPNGAAGVPVNGRVDLRFSAPVSAASVVNGVVTLSAGGVPVAGTVNVSSDRMTVTFTPAGLLAVSTNYTVNASGITDNAGNVMTPFTSAFTTGASNAANTTQPSVTSVSPGNGASGVAVTTSIVLTFNEAVDATTVNETTVPISVSGYSGQLAGSYSVNGSVVTFTPLSPLPGSATIIVQVSYNGVADLSGNLSSSWYSTFTTSAAVDTVAPQVVMVTPGNGMTGVGLNAVVTLTFSKSLNPNTISTSNFGLLVNGSKLGISLSRSADNTVVTLNAGMLPGSSVVTVAATSGVTDLAGNALSNFESTFTTGVADTTHPVVVNQQPGNGATGVPLNTNVVLYLSEAMNTATLTGAVHVSENGAPVSGTVQALDKGQVVVFTPSAPWVNGALIQVFVDATAENVDGNSLSAYQGSFTTVADLSAVAPTAVNTSPANGASNIATNVVLDVGFNEALSAATVNSTTAYLTQGYYGATMPATVGLIGGGTIIQIVPSAPLMANTQYYFHVTSGVLGTNGQAYSTNAWYFMTGSGTDTVPPAVVSVSPPNGAVNVGDNIEVHVVFSKPVNPLTVNAGTIQLSGGGATEVVDSISFSNNNQGVVLVPHGPLPDNTAMVVAINGVTDVAGNAVAAQTTTFTTGSGPDLTAPAVVNESPYTGEGNVPLNAVEQLQMSEPVDPGSVTSNSFVVQDNTTGQQVTGSYSVSADGRTVSFVPAGLLAVSRSYSVYFAGRGITDLAGNLLSCAGLCNYSFTTGTTANTTGLQVVGVSPANGLTGVPVNAQVVVQFNEPVDAATLGQVVLSGSSGNVTVNEQLTNANQTLTLSPVVPLTTNTTYTLTVAGVLDVAGNPLPSPVTSSFTTGTSVQLSGLSLLTASPSNGAAGVPTNVTIQLIFNHAIDPLTVTSSTLDIYPSSTGVPVPAAISFSTGETSVNLTPSAVLSASTSYTVQITNGITDLEGQNAGNYSWSFTTGAGPGSATPSPSRPFGSVLDTTNPLSTNLAGLFVMNEGTGTSDQNLVDAQPAEFSGVNPPVWDTLDPSIVFFSGGSLNSYLNAGTDLIFDQLTTNQMTVVAKVYVNGPAVSGVCEKNDDNAKDSGFVFGWDSSGTLRLTVEKSAANMRVATNSGVVPMAQWIQVAFTWDGTIGTAAYAHLFINGIEQGKASANDGTGTLGYANATNQPFRIGNASFDFAGSLNGKMAYLAVYKGRILSTTEMNALDAQLPIN